MPDPVDFYRAIHGRTVTQVTDAATTTAAPVVRSERHVHEKHGGESLARQRKAKLAGSAASEPVRLAQQLTAFVRLDYEERPSTFYVGHVGLI